MTVLLNFCALSISTGLGTGFSPRASGTVGSLACVLLIFLISSFHGPLSPLSLLIFALMVTCLGTWATAHLLSHQHPALHADRNKGTDKEGDPHIVVIDEWAGMIFALIGSNTTSWQHCLLAFFLFRTFDILKPGPIGTAEGLPGAWGIMLDDVLAGIASAAVMLVVIWIM